MQQTDQAVLSLRPGGGNRGVRIIGSRFDSSSAFGASDLPGIRPHGASFSIKTEGHERIQFARDQLLQLREALVNMISNPVNSTVPIAAEVFKKAGTYDEKKLFGVTTLDVVRAKTFYAGKANVNVADVNVPVVGGHAGITILPLFSQATPKANNLSDEVITALTKRTQDGGTEVVEAKAGKGSATLSMAYAGAIFADACLKGLNGVPDVVECSFVQSSITELPFFASKVRLGKNGVEEVLGLGALSDYEKQGLEALLPELKSSIEKGIKFANQS